MAIVDDMVTSAKLKFGMSRFAAPLFRLPKSNQVGHLVRTMSQSTVANPGIIEKKDGFDID